MSYRARKLIAVLLAIWLPLFSGSALAASVMMQLPSDACQEMGEHEMAPASTQCDTCDVCHLACGSYLAVQAIAQPDGLPAVATVTPYLFSFDSINSIPLLPPPLSLA